MAVCIYMDCDKRVNSPLYVYIRTYLHVLHLYSK